MARALDEFIVRFNYGTRMLPFVTYQCKMQIASIRSFIV